MANFTVKKINGLFFVGKKIKTDKGEEFKLPLYSKNSYKSKKMAEKQADRLNS